MSAGRRSVIPLGYVKAVDAAADQGINPEVLKRRLRNDPGLVSALGARKIPWRGGGLWVVPMDTRLPPDRRRSLDDSRAGEIARRAHAKENKAALAREFGVDRSTVYELMERYPPHESEGIDEG